MEELSSQVPNVEAVLQKELLGFFWLDIVMVWPFLWFLFSILFPRLPTVIIGTKTSSGSAP